MPRYSGIVQSVEQRTVNPYVTGSSPVARATDYKGFARIPFSFTLAFATYLLPKTGVFYPYFVSFSVRFDQHKFLILKVLWLLCQYLYVE